MKGVALIIILFSLAGCVNDELSWMAIHNQTEVPIYALPYSSEFTDGDWIAPGVADEFYSINCDCLDPFYYFSFYYDSLIIVLKDFETDPVKFYKDGTTVNYDPTLNPFTNPDVWRTKEFDQSKSENSSNVSSDHRHIFEHYFSISTSSIKSLSDTIVLELNPAS